ncbi:MAG: FkbM family methyltransferase [Anaerolineales bacterium]|nr:FkbM family methyltransferase [Chloroflexota bacterium]MBL6982318.1 FkbM family methyltransferase [Anaerolineales bacterium]
MNFFGMGWRIPLYKMYYFYFRTCINFREIIQYERKGIPFGCYKIRSGPVIFFKDLKVAHSIFKEVWLHQHYTRQYQSRLLPQSVVDIGANIGMFTLLAKHLWPTCAVYAYEPAPENYSQLTDNIQVSQVSDVFAHNVAVTNSSGTHALFINENFGGHSLYENINQVSSESRVKVEVETITLEEVIKKVGGHIDFLKLDCEGGEWYILNGLEEQLINIDYIAMEYHIHPDKKLSQIVALFEKAGFICSVEQPFQWGTWDLGMLYASKQQGVDT